MDTEKLRSIQRPLKDKYREDPGSALVVHKAQGTVGEDISFRITHGESVAVVGENGAGKSTLLNCLSNLKEEGDT